MDMKIARRIQFCAGHRVFEHEGSCRRPHGHNYVAFFTAESESKALDPIGRVIDFSVLKQKLGGWIEQNWDHQFLVYEKDAELLAALRTLPDSRDGLFVCPFNPTAERMAEYLLKVVAPSVLAGSGVRVTQITLWETENCYAEVSL
ncbi:MAG: 6-carboxytetrahydropterin synthase [Bdellovibrionaceae bacterium]|nr:6-carboxytetrahydropterin synthase [Pseudobdellovibrionaceae bacterium]